MMQTVCDICRKKRRLYNSYIHNMPVKICKQCKDRRDLGLLSVKKIVRYRPESKKFANQTSIYTVLA